MIVPSLSALLAHSIGNKLRNEGPSFSSILLDDFNQSTIFFISPLSFSEHEVGIVAIKRKTLNLIDAILMHRLHIVFLVVLG